VVSVTRAYGYARISEDPLGLAKGTGRQAEDITTCAAARGVDLREVLVDDDISALGGRHRPAYEQLMKLVAAGEVDVVVVYMTSRLWRNRRERAEGIELLARHRVRLLAVKGPDLDLSSAAGRMLAGLLGEVDTHESEQKRERVARAALQRAQEGRPNGCVPYGWSRSFNVDDRGRVTGSVDSEHPEQGPVVREIITKLLAGESLHEVTRSLNARGVPAPASSSWGKTSVRKIALRPGNAGWRVHHGQVIGRAAWPPLVDQDSHDRVTALLTAPGRRSITDGARRRLLTMSIGACGVCRGPLRVAPKGGHDLYVCHSPRGCVGRRVTWVDELTHDVMEARLRRPDLAAGLLPGTEHLDAARAHVAALSARLDTAADTYAAGSITAEQLTRITAGLQPQLEQARRDLAAALGPAPALLDGLTGDDPAVAWRSLPVTRQRAVMLALGLTVTIQPTRQGPGFRPQDIAFDWRAAS
jgi:site-specific DNA recombinase